MRNKSKTSEGDLPSVDVFKTLFFQQFRNPEDRYSELLEQLKSMMELARKDVQRKDFPLSTYRLLQIHQVAEVSYWCTALNVNTETFFRTLEIFDRFSVLFDEEINRTLKILDEEAKFVCLKRMVLQKSLRICSCIMLASKMHSNLTFPPLIPPDVKSALAADQKIFSLKAIAESEIRVLRVLNFRPYWISPFDLTEQLVSLVDLSISSMPNFYSVAILYLKYSYAQQEKIYAEVKDISRNEQWSPVDCDMNSEYFKRFIEYDSPLRAASVVAAAGFHVDDEFQKLATKKLAVFISEPDYKISTIARVMVDLVHQVHPREIPKLIKSV